ncbi:MAG: sensor histidine kinase, partial [Gemmatimonadales bacterium]
MRLPSPSRRRPRAAYITGLLVLALAFAVVLGLQAYGATQYQKAQAERVLQDYSAYAAARFASRSYQELYYYAFGPTVKAVDWTRQRTGWLPTMDQLKSPEDTFSLAFRRRVHFVFELDLPTRRITFAGAKPEAAWRDWLADTIAAQVKRLPAKGDLAALIGGPEQARALVVFGLSPEQVSARTRAVGVVADVEALDFYFAYAAESAPLIPGVLTGGVTLDSIGSVIVRDALGEVLYRTPQQYAPSITGRDTLGIHMAGLQVEVSLRPEIAGRLVIGGLPKSRLPLLVALFTLTAGLIVTALYQLSRETELAALRTDFVSGVSHELRTPLAQIRMFAETLVLGRVRSEEERRRSLEIIDQEARRLTNLVENLLHFSRSERQTLRVSPAPTLLGPLVRAVVESFLPLAETRQVRLETTLADGVAARVDGGALRQMLLNLLDNAVKYGPDGQTVTVGVEPAA